MKEQDCLRRFLFEDYSIRGVWVNLTHSWQHTKQYQTQPDLAFNQLGQALVSIVMLSTNVKFSGSMILQAQSAGAISTLVAQATNDRKIRGIVKCSSLIHEPSLKHLFGNGQLILTIELGDAVPYQGIVPLQGETLADALHFYFEQSEQLKTRLWLFANDKQAVGLLLQELPNENAQEVEQTYWEHIEILANTVTSQEMFDLDCHQLIHRLFHQEDVRLFPSEKIVFECACSRSRIEKMLKAMGEQELDDLLKERDIIDICCEFCNHTYKFTAQDIAPLFGR